MQAFNERLLAYLKSTEKFTTLRVQILAEGVVAAEDSTCEFDVYFDRETWFARRPDLWGETLFPPALQPYNISVICGTMTVKSFDEARASAQRNLASKFETTIGWNPREIQEMSNTALLAV